MMKKQTYESLNAVKKHKMKLVSWWGEKSIFLCDVLKNMNCWYYSDCLMREMRTEYFHIYRLCGHLGAIYRG